MHASKEVQEIEKKFLRTDIPEFRAGDTIRVHAKIKEGGKERIQYIEGVVIRKGGKGVGRTFTIRKISDGIGVELVYPYAGNRVAKVEVMSKGDVRRGRIYYLRGLSGKAARLKNKDGLLSATEVAAAAASKASTPLN